MTTANPAGTQAVACATFLNNWLQEHTNPSGRAETHKRQAVVQIAKIALDDPGNPENRFGYGYKGVDEAKARFDEAIRPAENLIGASNEAARANLCIELVDRVVQDLRADNHTTIFGVAKASYTPTWVDENVDWIEDSEQAPVNLTEPVVTEDAGVLSVTDGEWTGSPTFTYAWFRDADMIDGETDSDYTLTEADNGTTVTARVTATNDEGSTSVFATGGYAVGEEEVSAT